MPQAKLKNERHRRLYNVTVARLRRMVSFVRDYPDDEDAELFREAIKEIRVMLHCIKNDVPIPKLKAIVRISKIADDESDIEIMEWNDRMKRIEKGGGE